MEHFKGGGPLGLRVFSGMAHAQLLADTHAATQ